MNEEDDDDVDSGWESDEARNLTRAVDSSRLLEQFLDGAIKEEPSADLDATVELPDGGNFDLARTVEAPIASRTAPTSTAQTVRGGGVDGTEPPATRRATDDELRRAQRKLTTPDIRLGGGRDPGKAEGKPDAKPAPKRPDSKVHTRPTPPARPTSPAPAHTTSLRFPSASVVHDVRAARTATTKVNFNAVRPEDAPGGASPIVDLRLEEPAAEALDVGARPTMPPPGGVPIVDAAPETPRSPIARPAPGAPAAGAKAAVRPRGAMQPAPRPQPVLGLTPLRPSPAAKPPVVARAPGSKSGTGSTLKSHADDAFQGSEARDVDVNVDAQAVELSDDELAAISADASYGDIQDEATNADVAAPVETLAIGLQLDDPGVSSPAFRAVAPSPAAATPKPAAPDAEEDPSLTPIRIRFERGDYLGALLRAEALLEERPDMEAARRYVQSAQELLRQMYLEKLGSGDYVPKLALRPDEIQGLSLDHRAGFLMSIIDGVATIDEIVDISAMPALDALRLLFEMREQGVVAIDP